MKKQYIKNKSRSPLVYWLNIDDVQTVALEKLQRKLTIQEIEKIVNPINEQINWSEVISLAIDQHL